LISSYNVGYKLVYIIAKWFCFSSQQVIQDTSSGYFCIHISTSDVYFSYIIFTSFPLFHALISFPAAVKTRSLWVLIQLISSLWGVPFEEKFNIHSTMFLHTWITEQLPNKIFLKNLEFSYQQKAGLTSYTTRKKQFM
jgi:hypothetical protein